MNNDCNRLHDNVLEPAEGAAAEFAHGHKFFDVVVPSWGARGRRFDRGQTLVVLDPPPI
jgi:hypothetical protein